MSSTSMKTVLICAAAAAVFWVSARYLLPVLTPFLFAALLTLAAEPLVRTLGKRLKLSRRAAAGAGVTLSLILLCLSVTVLGALAVRQLHNAAQAAPALGSAALQGIDTLHDWSVSLAEKAPEGIRSLAVNAVEDLFSGSEDLVRGLTARIPSLLTGLVSRLSDSALGIGTFLIAAYMMSARLPSLTQWLRSHSPARWRDQWLPTLKRLKKSVFGWLAAQLKLMGITFCVLCSGFFLLRVTYAPVWAALISLIDALPILGTGTALIPWSLVCFIQGDTVLGVGLLGVYAVATLLRSILEPKLVGRQLGLDPLVTLLAMYTGYRLWGIFGLLIAPLLTVTVWQLFSGGGEAPAPD